MTHTQAAEPVVLVDPTGEFDSRTVAAAPRLFTLAGSTIALLDISKPRGALFLDRVALRLAERGATVRRFTKHSYARVADPSLRDEIAEHANAVIEALAD